MKFNTFFRSYFGQVSSKVILLLAVFIGLLLLLGDHGTPKVQYIGGSPLSPQKGQLLFRFSRLMDEKSVESSISIVPTLPGKMSWSGRTFAYTPDKTIGYHQTYTVTFARALDRELRSMPSQSFSVVTSPVHLVYLGTEGNKLGRILQYQLDTNASKFLTNDSLFVQSFEVSPDGHYIAFLAAKAGEDLHDRKLFRLYLYDLETTQLQSIAVENSWILDNIHWLPDSQGVGITYVTSAGNSEGIVLYDIATEKVSKIADGKARAYPYYFSPDSSQLAYIDTNGALILGSIPDGNGALVATTFTDIAGFDDQGKYLAYIAPRSVSTFDLTNVPILVGSDGEELKIPVPDSSNFDMQFIPGTTQLIWTKEKAIGNVRDDHLYLFDYVTKRLSPLAISDGATDLVPTASPDGQMIAWLRFYNENKGYVLSGWNDYQGKLIGGEIWVHDMITNQDRNTTLVGANVRFIP